MAKMGRPVTGDPSLHKVTVRLTDKEYQRLKAYAEANNQTMTQAMKQGIDLVYQSMKR
nr:CopG family transcriptional regulator [uncultured Anaerosporobacter sp.]